MRDVLGLSDSSVEGGETTHAAHGSSAGVEKTTDFDFEDADAAGSAVEGDGSDVEMSPEEDTGRPLTDTAFAKQLLSPICAPAKPMPPRHTLSELGH